MRELLMGVEISRLNLTYRMPDKFVGIEACLISVFKNLSDFRCELWLF